MLSVTLRVCTIAPKPAFKPLIEKKEAPINENYAEIRVSKEKGEKVDVGMFVHFLKLFCMKFAMLFFSFCYY